MLNVKENEPSIEKQPRFRGCLQIQSELICSRKDLLASVQPLDAVLVQRDERLDVALLLSLRRRQREPGSRFQRAAVVLVQQRLELARSVRTLLYQQHIRLCTADQVVSEQSRRFSRLVQHMVLPGFQQLCSQRCRILGAGYADQPNQLQPYLCLFATRPALIAVVAASWDKQNLFWDDLPPPAPKNGTLTFNAQPSPQLPAGMIVVAATLPIGFAAS